MDYRREMDESSLLTGLRAFYRGFVTGLVVVPLCVDLGRIFRRVRSARRALPTQATGAAFPVLPLVGSSEGSPDAV